MPKLQIEHPVRDYDMWKAAFESDPVGREAGGVRGYHIARPVDDPNYVVVELDFHGAAEAGAFLGQLGRLWGERGESLGLGTPTGRVVEVVETATLRSHASATVP